MLVNYIKLHINIQTLYKHATKIIVHKAINQRLLKINPQLKKQNPKGIFAVDGTADNKPATKKHKPYGIVAVDITKCCLFNPLLASAA